MKFPRKKKARARVKGLTALDVDLPFDEDPITEVFDLSDRVGVIGIHGVLSIVEGSHYNP